MRLKIDQQNYQLQGVNIGATKLISYKAMSRLLHQKKEALLVKILPQVIFLQGSKDVPPSVQQILDQFVDVFETPTTLPPVKNHDHKVELQLGTPPLNVRTYRYPHFQKK